MGQILKNGFDLMEKTFLGSNQSNRTNITENNFPPQNEPHAATLKLFWYFEAFSLGEGH